MVGDEQRGVSDVVRSREYLQNHPCRYYHRHQIHELCPQSALCCSSRRADSTSFHGAAERIPFLSTSYLAILKSFVR
jgi:hypothetical protein